MTRLRATLDRDLPHRFSVGRGNALFLAGECHADEEKLESVSIVANGAECEVIAHGMPPLDAPDRAGTGWFGILHIPAGSRGSVLRVGLRARIGRARIVVVRYAMSSLS